MTIRRIARRYVRGAPSILQQPKKYWRRIFMLFGEGGVVVRTPADASEGDPLYAETLIQPDGDLLMKLDRDAVVNDRDRIQEHLEQLRSEERALAAGRVFIRFATRWAAAIPVASALGTGFFEGVRKQMMVVIVVNFPVFLSMAFAWFLRIWVRRYVKKAMGSGSS